MFENFAAQALDKRWIKILIIIMTILMMVSAGGAPASTGCC